MISIKKIVLLKIDIQIKKRKGHGTNNIVHSKVTRLQQSKSKKIFLKLASVRILLPLYGSEDPYHPLEAKAP